jgi:peptidyl-prolyl cis-trans isomerase B (cyclophilin B)
MGTLLIRTFAVMLAAGAAASAALAQEAAPTPPPKKNERPAALVQKAEPFEGASVEKMAAQCVRLETEVGPIELEMLPEAAPESVRNFLNLTALGVFDTTTFSRVVKDFVIQGGNVSTRSAPPAPELTLRAARKIPDEPSYVKHVRGIVSMARPDEPNSASSHFFIIVSETAQHLDGKFAAFARVTRGMEVADEINRAQTEGDKPAKPVRITRATVFACQKAAAPENAPEAKPSTNPAHNPTGKVSP